MDQSYIEALMNAPSREESDTTAAEAVQKTWNEKIPMIIEEWRKIRLHLIYVRRHGNRSARREAWKLLHSLTAHRRRRRSSKRAAIYQRKTFEKWASEHWNGEYR
jgi:hypothetical protein